MTAKKKAAVRKPAAAGDAALFDHVAAILEQAHCNVVRAVNNNMVLAYWLIGREIVQEIQGGGTRAAYGEDVLESLSRRLGDHYGRCFSVANLKNFRQLYQIYQSRLKAIRHPLGSELGIEDQSLAISRPPGAELEPHSGKGYPPGSESLTGFASQLSWSHYRLFMKTNFTI